MRVSCHAVHTYKEKYILQYINYLLFIYDPKKLTKAKKVHAKSLGVRKGLNKYLYKFKSPRNKNDALLYIIEII